MTRLNRRRFTALALGTVAAPPALAGDYDEAACTRFTETKDWERAIKFTIEPDSSSAELLITFRHKVTDLTFNLSKDKDQKNSFHLDGMVLMFDVDTFAQWFESMPIDDENSTWSGTKSKAWVALNIFDPATDWRWQIAAHPTRYYRGAASSEYLYASSLKASREQTSQLLAYLREEDRTGLEIRSAGIAPDETVTLFRGFEISSIGLKQLIGGLEGAIKDLRSTATPEKCEGDCFLTTACCATFGRADACFELSTLRGFRDRWLARQPTGPAEIEEYYHTAPEICARIETDRNAQRELRRIYFGTILPCVALIKLGQHRAAYVLYKRLVRRLQAKYL